MKRVSSEFDYQQKLVAILIAMTLVGYSLYSFLSVALNLSEFDSRSITIPYRGALLGLSAGLFFMGWKRRRLVLRSTTHNLYFAVWLLYCIRLVYTTFQGGTDLSRPIWEFWAYAMGVSFFSFVGLTYRITDRTSRAAAWLIWGIALLSCILGIVTQRADLSIVEDRMSGNQILNAVSYGQTAVMLILMSGYLGLHVKSSRIIIILIIATAPAFWTIAASGSRSPLISLAIGIVLLARHGIKQGAGWRVSLSILIVGILLPIGLEYLLQTKSTLTMRLFETYDAYRIGEVDRFVLWGAAWDEISRSPLLGSGLELSIGVHPHNLILESFLSMGLVGGALFVWLVGISIRNSFRLLDSATFAWMAPIFMQFLALSLFSGAIYGSQEFWAIMLLQAGAIQSLARQSLVRDSRRYFGPVAARRA